MGAKIGQDQVVGDGRDLVQAGFAELALDVVVGVDPVTPKVSTQALAAAQEAFDASSFAIFASGPQAWPPSKSIAALKRIRSAASI